MKTLEIIIKHAVGLHARPAALFVQTAQRYASKVSISFNGKNVNGKSLLGVLSLGATLGSAISITADGSDEEVVLSSLKNLIEANFGE